MLLSLDHGALPTPVHSTIFLLPQHRLLHNLLLPDFAYYFSSTLPLLASFLLIDIQGITSIFCSQLQFLSLAFVSSIIIKCDSSVKKNPKYICSSASFKNSLKRALTSISLLYVVSVLFWNTSDTHLWLWRVT